MIARATIAAIVLLATPAAAQVYVWLPPAEYDHQPAFPVIELRQSWPRTRSICLFIGGEKADACSWWQAGRAYIAIPEGGSVSPEDTGRYRRHEWGHLNGAVGHENWR